MSAPNTDDSRAPQRPGGARGKGSGIPPKPTNTPPPPSQNTLGEPESGPVAAPNTHIPLGTPISMPQAGNEPSPTRASMFAKPALGDAAEAVLRSQSPSTNAAPNDSAFSAPAAPEAETPAATAMFEAPLADAFSVPTPDAPAPPAPAVTPAPASSLAPMEERFVPTDGIRNLTPMSAVAEPGAGEAGIRVRVASEDPPVDVPALLEHLAASGGSDLHLSAGTPPTLRINGEISPVEGWPRLTGEQVRDGVYQLINDTQRKKFESGKEFDFAYALADGSRFRANLMRERGNVAAVFRAIPSEIVPLEKLNLPKVCYNFAALPRGLVLITGVTGSGKSTTLASILDQVNRTRRGTIVTIEDPIEFIHQHRSCVVRQREVGADTDSFANALRHVLRQDPDVILVGELRDLETMSIALTAAETGHLVFATLHTQSAQDTVSRLVDAFPPEQQSQVRSQLANTLKAVVCQNLVKRKDGKGRVAATEVMVVNPAIASQIRRDESHQIPQSLQSGGRLGMHTLNQNLAELIMRGLIERDVAESIATDLTDLANLLEGKKSGAGAAALAQQWEETSGGEGAGLSGASL